MPSIPATKPQTPFRNPTQPALRSSAEWVTHFKRNANLQRPIPWELGANITPAELAEISASLRGWQLGETSDGSHLLAAAKSYSESIGDPDFIEAARHFIIEEQRHGEMLGRFLDLAQVPRAGSDWGDTLFRALRYAMPRMELWVTPVLMVETHAMIYYNALRRATSSPVLIAICRQILADEVPHIRFQCERLAILHRNRPRPLLHLTIGLQKILFIAISVAIWIGHRRALRAGGYHFPIFWRSAWRKMNRAWRLMSPDSYQPISPEIGKTPSNSNHLAHEPSHL